MAEGTRKQCVKVCFIVSNVQSPLIVLQTSTTARQLFTLVHSPTLSSLATMNNFYTLEHISTWLAWCFPGFHHPDEMQLDKTIHTRYTSTSQQLSLWVTLRNSVNKPTFQDSGDNRHNQQNKNKRNTGSHTRLTDLGAQFVSKPKDNQHITEKVHSKNNQ
eukprot:1997046-Amphidinium_carterae.3